ncbi:hypothetical protein M440DRAFT_1397670 [Trichoderma longibrachiatum ATCC 18648]|uniref:Uncharacterized protein n=1 Tax=Trichoderma longibrachiatum ATCC 18648 TaxID=983965 RepID=A0A2T4CFJ8_TRILO|nr:hypothetical protein M440DRAFT_1397670 [Trichoderma longibrachiatum ATCC 18648]
MAPGYRSPFDHHPPPPPKTIHDHHRPGAMLPLLAIIICMSVIVRLALITIRASFHRQQRGPEDDTLLCLPAAIALGEAAMAKSLVVRSGRDPQRAMDSRQWSLCEGEGCGVDGGSGQQPLLRAEGHGSLLSEDTSSITQAARQDDAHGKAYINWHGTNTLNTSWGWMA